MTSKSLNLSTIGVRNFLLCLITLLLPIGTWAEGPSGNYDIWIGGTQVTEGNALNVFGDNTVSWDNENNTLTLNNATIGLAGDGEEGSVASEAPGIKYTGTKNLTISLIGTNRIHGPWGCEAILYDGQSGTSPQLVFSKGDNQSCSLL